MVRPPTKTPSLAAVLLFSATIPFFALQTRAQEPPPANQIQPDPADIYFQGFKATRAAEKLAAEGDFIGAAEKLDEAGKCFESIRRDHPDWKKEMVAARVEKTTEAIASVRPKAEEQRRGQAPAAIPDPGAQNAAPDTAEIETLKEIIRRLSRAHNRRPEAAEGNAR